MTYLEANGHPVSEASITIPRRGRVLAEARLAVDAAKIPIQKGDRVSLTFETGRVFACTCLQAGFDDGLWRIQAGGGGGGLNAVLRPKFYAGISARSVLADILQEAGESAGRLDVAGVFERYVRMKEPAYLALETLLHAKFPGYTWRTGPNGAIDVLKELWMTYGGEITVSENYPAERRAVAMPALDLFPGVIVEGLGRVDSVRHVVGGQLRTEVYYL